MNKNPTVMLCHNLNGEEIESAFVIQKVFYFVLFTAWFAFLQNIVGNQNFNVNKNYKEMSLKIKRFDQ